MVTGERELIFEDAECSQFSLLPNSLLKLILVDGKRKFLCCSLVLVKSASLASIDGSFGLTCFSCVHDFEGALEVYTYSFSFFKR